MHINASKDALQEYTKLLESAVLRQECREVMEDEQLTRAIADLHSWQYALETDEAGLKEISDDYVRKMGGSVGPLTPRDKWDEVDKLLYE